MTGRVNGLIASTTLLLCILVAPGCSKKDASPIPQAGTRVTTTSEVFKRTASDLEQDCAAMGGCTCIMDGIQTTWGIVFACLDAGFCKLAP